MVWTLTVYRYGLIQWTEKSPSGQYYKCSFVQYEPWHYRYIGQDIATYIYQNNITFEEYYAEFIND